MTRLTAKHSITINGHSTSITLETDFWLSLKDIATSQNRSVNALIAELDQAQPDNLSSALRVYILNYYKEKLGGIAEKPADFGQV